MINRPSHAQLTLELTRASLQTIPAGVQPAHSPVVAHLRCTASLFGSPSAGISTGGGAGRPLATLIDIQRWRRKRATVR